jgi:hypothetical protein
MLTVWVVGSMQDIKDRCVNRYPNFDQIDFSLYDVVWGFYTLGFLKVHRPDCEFITPDLFELNSNKGNLDWLDQHIQRSLQQKKIVCVVVWDEYFLTLSDGCILNKYKDEPVWLITQLNTFDQLIYSHQHNISCKKIEIPWWHLNDCITYYQLTEKIKTTSNSDFNFLSMVGRPQKSKIDLAKKLVSCQLDKNGLIFMPPGTDVDFSYLTEQHPPYNNLNTAFPKMGAQFCKNNIWASANVENFLYLEHQYKDIPLVVHGETTTGIFFSTEKSLWPLLLGKLMIIYGRPGAMKHMQRFYDVDFDSYLNLEFDQLYDDYSDSGHQHRLELLVKNNKDLIENCKQQHSRLANDLEDARYTLGRNIYKYFIEQLEVIS